MYICGYIFSIGDSMKLHLKRDCSPNNVGFVIYDESGKEKYRAVSVKTKVTKKLNMVLLNQAGESVAKIRRLPIVGTCTFVLKVGKTHVTFAAVPTKNGILSYFYGNNWHVNGDLAAKNFTIIDVDKTVILNHRKHADYCTLEIFDADNELYCIAASICANFINTIEKPVVKAANI